MRYVLVLSISLFMLPTILCAETQYVSDLKEITLRTGPGAEYKITAMVKSGTSLEVLEQSEDWARVQLANGRDGWVLTQFLQSELPDTLMLETLKKTHTALSAEADTLRSENQDLKEKVAALTADLAKCRSEYDGLNTVHEGLKTESADFITLQENYKSNVEKLAAQKEKIDRLEEELSDLISDKRMKWFLLGAGVLVVGILIGFISKPKRRRSSLI